MATRACKALVPHGAEHLVLIAFRNRTDFYTVCGLGIFCNLRQGDVDFTALRHPLFDAGFIGWCAVEQDCDPSTPGTSLDDARANRKYLQHIGF